MMIEIHYALEEKYSSYSEQPALQEDLEDR